MLPSPQPGLFRVAPDTTLLSALQRAPTCARPATTFSSSSTTRPAATKLQPRREDAPMSAPPSGPGLAGLPTLPHPAPRAAHSGRPQPGAPRRPPALPPPSAEPSTPHAYRGAGASLELRPRPPPLAAAGASPALRGSRARHSHKMSALTELLPAATLRPPPPPPPARLFTAAYPSANAAVASAGRAEGWKGAVCLPRPGPSGRATLLPSPGRDSTFLLD